MNYHFKNFTVFLILFGCIALACFYFSAMLAIGTISGYQKFFDVFLQKNLLKQLASLWEYLEYYWKIWWKYRAKLELHSNNYFEFTTTAG